MSLPSWLHVEPGSVVLRIQAQPKASRSEVVGEHDGRLRIRVAAPPVDGEANEELLRFLKKLLRGPGISLELVRGQTSKQKDVRVSGVTADQVIDKLGVGGKEKDS